MCRTSSYIMGMVTGLAVGAAVLCSMGSKKGKTQCKRAIKTKANNAVKKFTDIIDDMM